MSDTRSSKSSGISGRLDGWSVLRCEGPDAAAFLQSQLSADVLTLDVGDAQWNAWLNAKGRLVALFLLLRSEQQAFDFLLPDHPADRLAEQLSRYLFRRKARVAGRRDVTLLGGTGEIAAGATVRLDGDPSRWLRLVQTPGADELEVLPDAVWRALDFRCGVPRIDVEGSSHTAHMLGLDRLQAISLSKGCYPGQEIVARTHYLGKSKRSLVCLRTDATVAPAAGATLSRDGLTIGEVLGAVREGQGGGWLIQAVASGLPSGSRCQCGDDTLWALELGKAPVPVR